MTIVQIKNIKPGLENLSKLKMARHNFQGVLSAPECFYHLRTRPEIVPDYH
jgi:hypothetical protein